MVFLSVSEKPNKFWKDSKYFLEITYSSTLKNKVVLKESVMSEVY